MIKAHLAIMKIEAQRQMQYRLNFVWWRRVKMLSEICLQKI